MNDFKNPIDAIKIWSLEIEKEWLKAIIDKVLKVKRELTDEETSEIYSIFARENDLDERENNIEIEETTPTSIGILNKFEFKNSIKKITLKKILNIEDVNALSKNQELLFHPKLTIIFGYNATGKSGYVRILKRVSKSRTSEDIWSNIHTKKEKNIGKAKFLVEIDGKEKEILWNGESEIDPLILIDVFDNKCVKVFLTDELSFGFNPYGFELFSIISNAINQLKEIFQINIDNKNQKVDFSTDFHKGTCIFKIIENISSDTDINEIEKLAILSEEELKNLDIKKSEKKTLETTNIEDKVRITINEKKSLEGLLGIIVGIKENFSEIKIQYYKDLINKYFDSKKNIEDKKIADLTEFNIPLQGSKEWDDFIQSAENYIKTLPEAAKYPSTDCKCIYCNQKLSEEAVTLIKRYRTLLESQEEEALKKYEKEIEDKIILLKYQNYSLNNILDIETILNTQNEEFFKKVKTYCEQAENIRDEFIDALTKKERVKKNFTYDKSIEDKLIKMIKENEVLNIKLKGDESQRIEKISKLNIEINELSDRKTLEDKKDQIIKYLKDLKWVKKAEDINRKTTTKPITDLSKRVWESLITDEFKNIFKKEKEKLNAPNVEFIFPGEYGVQKRSKSIEGMKNIDDFLSEGEQKAIALADFLAEISLKPINTPVIFDDPVTSFDHIRRKTIAERLCEESQKRQVIIFTHDILFLKFLKDCCKEECDVSLHWMEKENEGVFGKINLNDCPMLNSYKDYIKKVENNIQIIRTLSGSKKEEVIKEAFGYLRSSYESFVIEKIFEEIISRWSERVKMSKLKYVVYDEDLLTEVQNKFEELSQYIDAHTHSDIALQDAPDENKLILEFEHLKKLANDLKEKKKSTKVK